MALWQIFQNLLSNAIKYRSVDVLRITIKAVRQGRFFVVSVADNGSGFDSSKAEEVFELFKRAHSREIAGSGIGLATCRKLVEHHGGKIWAGSTPGAGSTFYFTVAAQPLPANGLDARFDG